MAAIEQQIAQLESQLSGNLLRDLDIREEIHNLKMKMNNVQSCSLDGGDCENCGS